MRRTILVAVATFLLGVSVGVATMVMRPGLFVRQPPQPSLLSAAEVSKVFLYAALKDGNLSGKFFNENSGIKVTQITVEALPKDERNPFNKFSPHLFDVIATANPRSMSDEFRVETGALNPDFHALRVSEAKGLPLHE